MRMGMRDGMPPDGLAITDRITDALFMIACARDVLEVGDVSSCSPSGLSPFERADSNSVVPSLSDACADSESLCHVARA